MAIAFGSLLAELYSSTDATSYTAPAAGSFDPPANALLICAVQWERTPPNATPTLSGGSLTWSACQDRTDYSTIASPNAAIGWFWAVTNGSPPTGVTVTLDFAGETQTGAEIQVFSFTGAHATSPKVQSKTNRTNSAIDLSVTLDAGLQTDSATFVVCGTTANNAITPRGSWTEIGDNGHASPAARLETQYRLATSETTGSCDPPSTPSIAIIMVEIAIAAASASLTPSTGGATLTGASPSRVVGTLLTAAAAATLALAGAAPTAIVDTRLTPATGAVSIAGEAPTLQAGGSVSLTPATGALSLTGEAPSTAISGISLVPATGALALEGAAPRIIVDLALVPGAGSLTLDGQTPRIPDAYLTPGAGALTLDGQTPSLSTSTSAERTPSTGALALTGEAPACVVGTILTPGAASLTLTGAAPRIPATYLTPGTGTLTLTGAIPTVSRSDVSAVDRYAPYDLDALADAYAGRLVNGLDLAITRALPDALWADPTRPAVQLVLDNHDGGLTSAYRAGLEGRHVDLTRYDVASADTRVKFRGAIVQPALHEYTLEAECAVLDPAAMDAEIPSVRVTTTAFPKAVDIGADIPVLIGSVVNLPLLYVNDDVAGSFFDYLVAHGTVAITALARNIPGSDTTLFKSITFSECLRAAGGAATSWSEVARTDLYPGYTAVRFALRQGINANVSSGLHTIYADVTGFSTERNPVQLLATLLGDTTWGCGLSVNAASVTAAAAEIPSGLVLDGALRERRKARDWVGLIGLVRGLRCEQNASGEITVAVDSAQNTVALHISDDLGDGPRNRVASGPRVGPRPEDRVKTLEIRYREAYLSGEYTHAVSRAVNATGRTHTIEHPLLRDHTAADMVADYLGKRVLYGQETIDVTVTQEGRALALGDLVMLTKASQGYDGDILRIRAMQERLTALALTLEGYSWLTYLYEPGTLPADAATASETDLSRTVPTTPTTPTISASGTRVAGDGHVTAWVTLSSTVGTSNVVAIRWRYRVNGTTPWIVGTTTTGTGAQTATIEGLLPNTSYDYSVEAVNAFSLTAASANLSAQTSPTDSTVPSAPTGLSASAYLRGTIVSFTSALPADFDVAILYRHTSNSSGSATEIQRGKSRLFIDQTGSYATQYFYWIKIQDLSGNLSSFSSSVNATTARVQGAGGNADIDTGSPGVGTTNIVANAATGVGSDVDATDDNTTSSSFVDISGRSVAVTISSTASPVLVFFTATIEVISGSGTDRVIGGYVALTDGSDTVLSELRFEVPHIDTGDRFIWPVALSYVDAGVSGSKTYKARWRTSSTNTTLFLQSESTVLQVVELKR